MMRNRLYSARISMEIRDLPIIMTRLWGLGNWEGSHNLNPAFSWASFTAKRKTQETMMVRQRFMGNISATQLGQGKTKEENRNAGKNRRVSKAFVWFIAIWGVLLLLKKVSIVRNLTKPVRRFFTLYEDLPLRSHDNFSTSSQHNPEKGCALLFFGLPRSFQEICLPSIQENIVKHNENCDIFVHTYNVTGNVGNRRGEKQGGRVHPEHVSQLTQHVVMDTEDQFLSIRNLTYFRQFFPRPSDWHYPTSMDNMIRQWHSIDGVWSLMERQEDLRKANYEQVGFFRLDVKFLAPIDIYSGNAVIPDEHGVPTMINDRVFFGKRQYAKQWGTARFPTLETYIREQTAWFDSLPFLRTFHRQHYPRNSFGAVPLLPHGQCRQCAIGASSVLLCASPYHRCGGDQRLSTR